MTANISIDHFTSSSTNPVLCYAPFQDIRNLFKSDKFNVLKRAPKLTAKACWPSRLERQNVSLALKIFHETTSASLLAWKLENNIVVTQTVELSKVWKLLNANWVGKNIRFKDDYLAPIYPADLRLQYIRNIVSWLDNCVYLPFISGMLTRKVLPVFDTHVRRYHCWSYNLSRTVDTSHCEEPK